MRNTISKIIFLSVTALLILIPAFLTNVTPNQVSEFDNRKLQEFPSSYTSDFNVEIENYLADRVGLRNEMITAYQNFCDVLFHKLVHPSYIYGKGEHIIAPWDLVTFQHLDVDVEYIDYFTDYLKNLEAFCEHNNSEFLFYLVPNKESVYPEVFPDGYNIKNQPNRSEKILARLDEMQIPYLYPLDMFTSLKNEHLLYNVKFDAGHWNETGAFFGHQQILQYINQIFPQSGELEADEFEITQNHVDSLLVSRFEIDEMVPSFSLRSTYAVTEDNFFEKMIIAKPEKYHIQCKNEVAAQNGAPRILIFGDSYFENAAKFYMNHCAELFLIHAENMPYLEYYISSFQPDIVIYEAVERVLGDSLDDFKREKRYYKLRDLQSNLINNDPPYAKRIEINADISLLQAQSHNADIVHFAIDLHELEISEFQDEIMLIADVNGHEYYSIWDEDSMSYHFSFSIKDLEDCEKISLYEVILSIS